MLNALDSISIADWRVTTSHAIEAQDAKAHLVICMADFSISPTDDRMRALNNAWMRAKNALKITTPASA